MLSRLLVFSFFFFLFSFSQDFKDPEIVKMLSEVSSENIKKTIYRLTEFETRHTLSDTISDKVGIGAARRWIKSEFEKNSHLVVEFDSFLQKADGRRIEKDITIKNVVATLKGSDPNDDRIIIVSGHYDSRVTNSMNAKDFAPGANDDASGTAVVMELARVMSKYKFNCTMKFVAVAAEEQGLYGSKNLAKVALKNNWNVIAMITNDIVGNTISSTTNLKDNSRVRIFSEGVPAKESERMARARASIGSENDSPARLFARYIKDISERYVDQLEVNLVYRRDRYLRGGDHTPFSNEGFTAIRITEMNENYLHQHQDVRVEDGIQYGDLPEFVDYDYAQKVAHMNLSSIATLARSNPAPKNVRIDISKLTNETTLFWDEADIKPDSYIVLMRKTSSPNWEKKINVGSVRFITVPYSKDNYLFAVQSISKSKHESLAVFPLPGRFKDIK